MNLKITQLNFCLTVTEKISLHEHPESTFRGAFGQELRAVSCVYRNDDCLECTHERKCTYAQIFEPKMSAEESEKASRGFITKPRPYIIEVKINEQTEFKSGDAIHLQMCFFGEIKQHLPFIILAWQRVGRIGIGREEDKFEISEIWCTNPLTGIAERIYSEYLNMVSNKDLHMEFEQVEILVREMPEDSLTLRILSPMLLKADKQFVKKLEFEILMRNLFRRLSSLFLFYGDGELGLDYAELLAKARKIKLIQDKTRLENWCRFSNRQNQRVEMFGLLGEVTYSGDLRPFLPYLVYGQYCYIGKNTVFGQGSYKIMPK